MESILNTDIVSKIYSFLPIRTFCHKESLLSSIRKKFMIIKIKIYYRRIFHPDTYIYMLERDISLWMNSNIPIQVEITPFTREIYKNIMGVNDDTHFDHFEVHTFLNELTSLEICKMYFNTLTEEEVCYCVKFLLSSYNCVFPNEKRMSFDNMDI